MQLSSSTLTQRKPTNNMAHSPHHPALPRPIDQAIAQAQGSSVALDATAERLQAAKYHPTPSLSEIIEARTRENSRLRAELAYFQQVQQLGEHLKEELQYVTERLQLAVNSYNKGQKDLDQERLITSTDVGRSRGYAGDRFT